MNLIVHIGIQKTGTTTIQKILFNNKEILKSKGFHFLQSAGPRNNRKLPTYCIDDEKDDDFFRDRGILSLEGKIKFRENFRSDLDEEICSLGDGIHTVITSSEHFSSRLKSYAEIKKFYDLISPYFANIRILCWLREQCELAISGYSTAMRSGVTLDFDEYLKECQPDNIYYNYYKMLNMWSSVFGFASIKVKIFSKSAFVGDDLICDYLSCVSPDLIAVVDKNIGYQNVSINAFGQGLLLSVNRLLPKYVDGKRLNKSQPLRRRIVEIIESCFSGFGTAPSTSDYQRICDSFYESNKMLSKKYLSKNCKFFDFSPPCRKNISRKFGGFTLVGFLKFTKLYIGAHPSLSSGFFRYCELMTYHCTGVRISKSFFKNASKNL
jgi:hypothetical protein